MKKINERKEQILDFYSKYVLRHNEKPLNVYTFCENHNMSEVEFYSFYAGLEQLEEDYLRYFFRESVVLLLTDESYPGDSAKNKLLSLYYTFFEQLTLNRSLVIYLIDGRENNLAALKKVWTLKPDFTEFVKSLELSVPLSDIDSENMLRLEKLKNRSLEELIWGNFLSVLKFWLDDRSPNFEKTDVFIEKSVDTGFELLDVKPLKKLLDLGKFLFNEKVKSH
ncbi:TetR family transcriptional regulator C-terminal domain-containing protein [Kaistella palustris]|uniref:TetR family transcriptional regulator C-terminal domain-containing protein n=1 Tax=Kaistella palustris TaxID=493376 RepID=UPI00041B4D14|nr:TetR family transcriptional regulator C-terminal domain-containing protein [Kaistella palustris]